MYRRIGASVLSARLLAGTTNKNLEDFAKFAQKVYEKVTPDTIHNCFKNWDDRRVAMVASKGGAIPW